MRGFLLGTLVLIAAYVAGQNNTAAAAQTGGNWFLAGLQRALSPNVAGVPQRGTSAAASSSSSSGPYSGAQMGAVGGFGAAGGVVARPN